MALPETELADLRDELARLRAEVTQMECRFSSFIDSETESIFCYELVEPVAMSQSAEQVAEAFSDSILVVANKAFALSRGATEPKEFYGRVMRDLARERLPRVMGLIQQLIKDGNRPGGVEVKQPQPNGDIRYALSNANLVQAKGHYTRLWVILRDITEQKRLQAEHDALQAQYRQSQRMESLGLLAGGVAHDFNNLLVVIENCAQFVGEDMLTQPAQARESLRQIEDAAARAAALVRSLMAFSRPTTGTVKELYLDGLIGDLSSVLARLIPSRIRLKQELHSGAPLRADPRQLEQILVNLVINAVDAIDDEGEVTIRTENVEIGRAQMAAHPWAPAGWYARLGVSDTGRGVAPEVRSRLFEPFFTTKPEGKGNGLGLSVVWGAVKRLGGFVDIVPAEADGSGTQFCVYLPKTEAQVTAAPFAEEKRPSIGIGSETVLLADDHDLVRDVTKLLLQRAGYRVLVAKDGQEALDLFAANAATIELVILDAIMPRVTGFEAYQAIRKQDALIPILVASGHTSDVFPQDWIDTEQPVMLAKPFTADQLLSSVRTLLDQAT